MCRGLLLASPLVMFCNTVVPTGEACAITCATMTGIHVYKVMRWRARPVLLSAAAMFVPGRTIQVKKRTHPWLTDRCLAAIQRKCDTEGTSQYAEVRHECSSILSEEYRKYVHRLKSELAALPKTSKLWWKLNRELLNKKAALSTLPRMKVGPNMWLSNPAGKANLIAAAFESKWVLPAKCDRVGGPTTFPHPHPLGCEAFESHRRQEVHGSRYAPWTCVEGMLGGNRSCGDRISEANSG